MNREILFRGRSFSGGSWVYGDLEYERNKGLLGKVRIHTYKEDGSYDRQYLVESDTVGQFTGLRDKNGVKIFEGDIIKHPYVDPIFRDLVEMKDGEGVTSEVIFHDGAFVVKYDYDDLIYLDAFTRHGYAEVIGNIYDNPELLSTK